jgi:sugar phosphate isomerase/epimerase
MVDPILCRGQRTCERPQRAHLLPFRLGTTSYILPDDLVPNVEFLAGRVEDVELVLFESDEVSNLPGEPALQRLAELAGQHGLTYTVHLPLDADLGRLDEAERRRAVAKCERIMRRVERLAPFAYLVHFHREPSASGGPEPAADWLKALRRSAEDLCGLVADPQVLCVETLSYPFAWVEAIPRDLGMGLCLDVGHVLLAGESPEAYLDRYLDATRVVHLHGLRDGRDHRDLGGLAPELLRTLLDRLLGEAEVERVVTLEVFSRDDFEASMSLLERRLL